MALLDIHFTWFIIELIDPIQIPVSVQLASGGLLPSSLTVKIPIPLKGLTKYDRTLSNLIDVLELHSSKSLSVLTETVSQLVSAHEISDSKESIEITGLDAKGTPLNVTTDNGALIKFANPTITSVERGEETFQLALKYGIYNPLAFIVDMYMEIASKTTWNVRFHYISESLNCFNMILSNYSYDKSGLNPIQAFVFTKPAKNKDQSNEDIITTGVISR